MIAPTVFILHKMWIYVLRWYGIPLTLKFCTHCHLYHVYTYVYIENKKVLGIISNNQSQQ